MKKKIVSILIVSMFLLTCLVTMCATGSEENLSSDNHPPETPTLTGETNVKEDTAYAYDALTTDPDGDDIYYKFDFDDGDVSDWCGPKASGVDFRLQHDWDEKGTYFVKAKAKDEHGAESEWGTLKVTVPKTTSSIIDIIENRLDRCDWPFPMLRVILWRLGK